MGKAPESVVQEEREKLTVAEGMLEKLKARLHELKH